ncbi:MAG: hypothetical protein IPL61_10300 [Myxococcales bacterium]|nr:hypothetical protein [Myxococcales bacterium]
MGRTAAAVITALSLLAGPAWAGGPGDDGTHHKEGEYGGVSPSGRPSPDAKTTRPAPKTLGWVGFRAEDGAGEVFFQAAQPFTISQRVEGGEVIVSLAGLTRQAHNTRRPLDTRFFDAPVARISARTVKAARARKGKPGHPAGVEVRIAFKSGAPVSEGVARTATEPDGLSYVYLTFAGAAPSAGPDDSPE